MFHDDLNHNTITNSKDYFPLYFAKPFLGCPV